MNIFRLEPEIEIDPALFATKLLKSIPTSSMSAAYNFYNIHE